MFKEDSNLINNNEVTGTETESLEDIDVLKTALLEEKNKAEGYLANWQRTKADLDNYRKQAEQEKAEIIEFANKTLILSLITVLDDFERAFTSMPAKLNESSWTEGIKLIYNKLKAILLAQGLVEIKAQGELFDPCSHEAVMQQEGQDGIVIQEIQKGYKLKDRVIRCSLVTVGSGVEEKIKIEDN